MRYHSKTVEQVIIRPSPDALGCVHIKLPDGSYVPLLVRQSTDGEWRINSQLSNST